jgi:cell shape-determining protein MreC
MIHQFQDKKNIARRKFFTQILIFVSVFLLLSISSLLYFTGRLFTTIGRPIWSVERAIVGGVDNLFVGFHTRVSLSKTNDALGLENATLKTEMINYKILKVENDQLKELIGRLPSKQNFLLADILAKPDLSPYDTIVVNAGSNLGVTEGQAVYANGNIPIGSVNKIYSSTSLIMLYSNPGQVTHAVLDGSNNAVQLIGRGGGNFEMKIPQELLVDKGALVVVPRAHGTGNEVVAIVEEVMSSTGDPYKKVLLRSPVNIQDLKWVEIAKE